MQKFSLLMIVSFVVVSLYAQEKLSKVKYNVLFNRKYDQQGADVRSYTGILTISNSSRSDFFMTADAEPKPDENTIELDPDTIWRVRVDMGLHEMCFNDIFNEKLESKWYSDTLYPMEWVIDNEERLIDSIRCIRATADFRGRTYIAWFSPDIALPFGPWKMGGLPGLIVELEDDRGFFKVKMLQLQQSNGSLMLPALKLQSFRAFVSSVNTTRRTMKQAMRNTNCIDCESSVRFHSWEKVFSE